MTAPAIPTPADLARRAAAAPSPATRPADRTATSSPPAPAQPSAAATLTAPGRLYPNEVLRQAFQQSMRISRMNAESRLVALTLLGFANFRTGLLNKYQPTSAQLAAATGLTEGQVLVQLEVLTQRGWLTQRALTTGPRKGQEVYQLCIPQAVLSQLRASRRSGKPV
ncbi:hypothetical protein [Streptomyces sp. NPDC051636]|uniref:hypothetical protein n=1 Tax=Streptomyces sp. NPDC051636 TaxID=3365663 RepID=UPI003789D0C2